MTPIAPNIIDIDEGFLWGERYLIADRSSTLCP
jgi:hypothetical protein